MSIPGLLHIPVEESSVCEPIALTSFDLKAYTVPGAHKFGKCRPVAEFDRIRVIGEGSYGTVYQVRDQKTGDIFALKRLKIGKELEMMPQNFLREITNLKLLKHDNIISFYGIAVGKHFVSTYLILEYCEYSLSTVIDEVDSQLLQQPQIKNIMRQLLVGVDYIHKHFLMHRDLSPSNILFNEAGVLKISDFGLSRKNPQLKATPGIGLQWYKAPEILFGSENYTSAIDIWCVGCIFAEMIRQKSLFHGESEFDIILGLVEFLGTPTDSLWPDYSKLPFAQKYELILQPYNRIRSTFELELPSTVAFLHKVLQYNPKNRYYFIVSVYSHFFIYHKYDQVFVEDRPTAEQCLQLSYFNELPEACKAEDLLKTLQESVSRKI